MLNRIVAAQVSDTTGDDSSNAADLKKLNLNSIERPLSNGVGVFISAPFVYLHPGVIKWLSTMKKLVRMRRRN